MTFATGYGRLKSANNSRLEIVSGARIEIESTNSSRIEVNSAARIELNAANGRIELNSPNSNIQFDCASDITFDVASGDRFRIGSSAIYPAANNTYDCGTSSYRFRNIYTNDLQLSNEGGSGNDVDGTTGDYTIQEGADELYLINNKNGKKYKFNLTEVS